MSSIPPCEARRIREHHLAGIEIQEHISMLPFLGNDAVLGPDRNGLVGGQVLLGHGSRAYQREDDGKAIEALHIEEKGPRATRSENAHEEGDTQRQSDYLKKSVRVAHLRVGGCLVRTRSNSSCGYANRREDSAQCLL